MASRRVHHSTDPLRAALARQARIAARRLRRAGSVGLHLQEETITEMFLLALATSRDAKMVMRAAMFSRQQEGRTGADWLWVFQGATGRRVYLLVQAKRQRRHRRYATNQAAADLQKAPGIATQRDVLLARGRKLGVRTAYAFYNPAPLHHPVSLECGTWDGLLGPLGGITMASAQKVHDLADPTSLSDIATVAWPLSCALLCWHHPQVPRSSDTLDLVIERSLNASGITAPAESDDYPDLPVVAENLLFLDLDEVVAEVTRLAVTDDVGGDDREDSVTQFLRRPEISLQGVAVLSEELPPG